MIRRCGPAAALALALAARAGSETSLPPPPRAYFNDEAAFVGAEVARRLDEKLRRFDEQTGNQIVVVVFPKLPSPSLEDFTVRTAQAWRVGRKELDNGAVLFVFVQDRKLRLEVGYGLEERIPDIAAKRIVSDVIAPRFRAGDPAAGLEAGIDAVLAAARGTPQEAAPSAARRVRDESPSDTFWALSAACFMLLLGGLQGGGRGVTYTHGGRQRSGTPFSGPGCLMSALGYAAFLALLWFQGFSLDLKLVLFVLSLFVVFGAFVFAALARAAGSGGGWSSGGGWTSGGAWPRGGGWSGGGWSGGGGGGGFSGGGGSFGGGGASGSW
jgi:uncharacterized protein